MEAKLRGHAHKYGKNVDTDVIIPGKYCNIIDPAELGKHALEGLDPEYTARMKAGDIIVADTNFGCGSSREVAPIAIKGSGTSAVIAKSFARIFYRNALNIGLPIFESAEAVDGIETGDEIELEPATGVIRNLTKGTQYQSSGVPAVHAPAHRRRRPSPVRRTPLSRSYFVILIAARSGEENERRMRGGVLSLSKDMRIASVADMRSPFDYAAPPLLRVTIYASSS